MTFPAGPGLWHYREEPCSSVWHWLCGGMGCGIIIHRGVRQESRGVEYCHQCTDFPCEELMAFKNDDSSHHSTVLHNLSRMQEIGIGKWLKEQELRWSCPECNEKYSWYDNNCSKCGSPVRNCIEDEKELEK